MTFALRTERGITFQIRQAFLCSEHFSRGTFQLLRLPQESTEWTDSWEVYIRSASEEISPPLLVTDDRIPCAWEPRTGFRRATGPTENSPHSYATFHLYFVNVIRVSTRSCAEDLFP
jgi:hypothetical protein